MAERSALLLNDTSRAYHWGCFGTSIEIQLQLEQRGYSVNPVSVVSVQNVRTPPRTSAHMLDAGFQRVFLADNPRLKESLAEADIVVVNGEGTLHGRSQSVFNLLYLIRLAKHAFGKPVYVINTSLFPNDDEAAKLYGTLLQDTDAVVVRDEKSFAIAQTLELKVTLGFDCLPLFMRRKKVVPIIDKSGPVVVGGGLGLQPDRFGELMAAVSEAAQGHPLCYVTGAPDHAAQDDAPLIDAAMAAVPALSHTVAESFEHWESIINEAPCLMSGRFHHTIVAAYLETPVVAFKAGTPKVDAVCQALGLDEPLDAQAEVTKDTLTKRVTAILADGGRANNEAHLQSCLDLAKNNFLLFGD